MNASKQLREIADQLDKIASVPEGTQADLGATLQRLRLLGLDACNLQLSIWLKSEYPPTDRVEWSVWDGSEHYKSPILGNAVQMCVTAHMLFVDPICEAVNVLAPPAERIADLAEKLTSGDLVEVDFSTLQPSCDPATGAAPPY